jgi:hypothetical protein
MAMEIRTGKGAVLTPANRGSAATVGVASGLVAAANPARRRLSIRNNSANTIYLQLGEAATVAGSYPLRSGEEWTEDIYDGAVYAISESAGCNIRVQEV